MENNKNSFMFYRSWFEALDNLPDDTQLILYRAITHYVFLNEEPNLNQFLMFGFNQIKDQVDRDNDKWEDKREKRRNAGRLGAQKTNEKRWGDKSELSANVSKNQQMSAKSAVDVNVDVDDNVDVNVDVDVDVNGTHKCVCDNNNNKSHTHIEKSLPDPPSIQECIDHAVSKGFTSAQAETFFYFYDGNGWQGVKNWKSKLTYWCQSDSKGQGFQIEKKTKIQREEDDKYSRKLDSIKENKADPQQSHDDFDQWLQDHGYDKNHINQKIINEFRQYCLK